MDTSRNGRRHSRPIMSGALLCLLSLGPFGLPAWLPATIHAATDSPSPATNPDALMQQGASAYQRGAFDQALTHWKEAAQRYEEAGNPKDQSRALVQAAQASQALGHPKLALQQLDLALALTQQVGQPAATSTRVHRTTDLHRPLRFNLTSVSYRYRDPDLPWVGRGRAVRLCDSANGWVRCAHGCADS